MGKERVLCMMGIEYIISINHGLSGVYNFALREILKCVLFNNRVPQFWAYIER
jgi:hypothetical protein